MSHANISTEGNVTEDVAHCHRNDEQPFTSGSTKIARQITEANKARSPLMKLPAEIRVTILRMLVGDKLIRVDARGIIFRGVDPEEQESLDGRQWTLARRLLVTEGSSDGYPLEGCKSDRWGDHFDILKTSHQLHREAFPLFWRTCQFGFEEEKALVEFVNRLGKAQKANLKRLVIVSYHCNTWDFTSRRNPWASSFFGKEDQFPLDNVCDLVLNLRFDDDGWQEPTIASRKALVLERFKMFEPLRLLALKWTKVILLFNLPYPPRIDEQNMIMEAARLEDTLSKRLLDPTITKADLVNAMTERIKRLEVSKDKAQTSVEVNQFRAEEALRLADRYRVAAEEHQTRANVKRDTIERLQTGLQRDGWEEMERLAMPQEVDEEARSDL